jgi:hypothetical protein
MKKFPYFYIVIKNNITMRLNITSIRYRGDGEYDLIVEGNNPAYRSAIAGYPCSGKLKYWNGRYYYIDFPTKSDGSPSKINRKTIMVTADRDGVWVHTPDGGVGSWDMVAETGSTGNYQLNDKQLGMVYGLFLWANWHTENTSKD